MTKTPLTVTAEQIKAATDRGIDVTRMMDDAAASAIADEEGRKLAQLCAGDFAAGLAAERERFSQKLHIIQEERDRIVRALLNKARASDDEVVRATYQSAAHIVLGGEG